MDTAILFLIFNRPESTQKVFEVIRAAKPKRLYIAADGPRKSKLNEVDKCNASREIVNSIDWECKVKTLFRESNLGCKKAVSSAINWFFENEEEGIILEDDILPHPDFFRYCEELLDRYRNNSSIGVISGHNHVYNQKAFNGNSYDFVAISHCWGWATWKHSWNLVDVSLKSYNLCDLSRSLNNIYSQNSRIRFWEAIFLLMKQNLINSWAYPMTLSLMINEKLSVIPALNLTKNIGDGEDATHTSKLNEEESRISLQGIYPLTHPKVIKLNETLENIEVKNEQRHISFYRYLKIRLSILYHKICD
ncbi:MAG: nucleotide-diphospho-sugar transferase [Duncaniella sp.]|nr:nucleotide-diphospho-sugar transferase [Duncaniella sp.]